LNDIPDGDTYASIFEKYVTDRWKKHQPAASSSQGDESQCSESSEGKVSQRCEYFNRFADDTKINISNGNLCQIDREDLPLDIPLTGKLLYRYFFSIIFILYIL
jgi:hypothetical protein